MSKYLDLNGLSTLWGKIKDKFVTEADFNYYVQVFRAVINREFATKDELNSGLSSKQNALGINPSTGSANKFLNQQGQFATVETDLSAYAKKADVKAWVDAESSRVTAENKRVEAESTRSTNEDERVSAETNRAKAESSRVTAETGRVDAESSRVTAEQSRSESESTRESNETTRLSNENARIDAEKKRADAETARVKAEKQRETDFSSAKSACETATANANTATANANAATTNANTAADKANGVVSTMEKNMLANVSEVEKKAACAKYTIDGLVNGLSVTQTTGDSTTSIMSQKAVTDVVNENSVSETFYRWVGLSDVEKFYYDRYWSKDLAVHIKSEGVCSAVLLRNNGSILNWQTNNYGNWQYAILCNGVNEDGSIIDGKLCTDVRIDATGYKFILLSCFEGNRVIPIIPYEDDVIRNGVTYWEEKRSGATAISEEIKYASRLPLVIDEFKNGTMFYNLTHEKDTLALFTALKSNAKYYHHFSLIRHFPYINLSEKNNVGFFAWVNLIDVVWGDYKKNDYMFGDCHHLEHVYGFEDSDATTINKCMFIRCYKINFRHLPSGITDIGWAAFQNCTSLALTELPAGVTSIGWAAFQNCTSLALTELPAGVTSIGGQAFQNCTSLALTELPAGVTSIGGQAFRNCTSLALTELPAGVTGIPYLIFENCHNITISSIPEGVTSIDNQAFASCTSIKTMRIPESLTSFGIAIFKNCNSLESVTFPKSLKVIGTEMFSGCNKLSLDSIQEGVTKIGDGAFWACNIKEITLPSSLTSIGGNSFGGMNNVKVTCLATTPPSMTGGAFGNTVQIKVPADSVDAYKSATGWKSYANNISAIE